MKLDGQEDDGELRDLDENARGSRREGDISTYDYGPIGGDLGEIDESDAYDDRYRRKVLSSRLRQLLWTTIFTQILTLVVLYQHPPMVYPLQFDWQILCASALQVPQILGVAYGSIRLLKNIDTVSVADSWNMYLATALGFSGVYFLAFIFTAGRAFVANDPRVLDSGPDTLLLTLTYYSISAQTLTSPGDVSPVGGLPGYLSVLQMLIGMLYSVFIISHTQELFDHGGLHAAQNRLRKQRQGYCGRCWDRVTNNPILHSIRVFLRRYLIVVSVVIWVLNLVILHVLEPNVFRNWEYRIGVVVVECVFQFLQIGTVVFTSAKFVRHVDEITLSFLAQTFVAVCLTFSGLYNLLFVFSAPEDRAFSLVGYEVGRSTSSDVVQQLFYFSVSMMTTAGIGDVYPRKWFSQLLAAVQMLLSVLYTIIVLGRGVSRLNERRLIEKARLEMYTGAGISVPLSRT